MAETVYFAWVNEGEVFNPAVHNRNDEDMFSIEFEHSEGDFAGLKLTIKNPRIGMLNPGRKVWGILSFNDGVTITPIFRGRLIGVPTNVFSTLVSIEFTARPYNYIAQKQALAVSLRTLPEWDPIFISPESWDDPDTVLEARSALWHINPVTHVVSVSNVLINEDGIEEFTEDQHWYDDLDLTLNQTPLRSVTMVATIPWTQSSEGSVDLTYVVRNLFQTPIATSFTMSGLSSSWPKPGAQFGSGWEVVTGSMVDVSYQIPKMKIEDIFYWQGDVPIIPEGSIIFPLKVTGEFHSGEKAGFNLQYGLVVAQLGYGVPTLSLTYAAGREFAQIVTFTMQTDQQSIVTLPGEDEGMVIALSANNVSGPTYDMTIPIVNPQRRNFIHTARGLQAVEHLLLLARANLIARSRAVEITIKSEWRQILRALSLRKSARIFDHRLPGGVALGKITKVALSLSGESGAAEGTVTIACCVGKGGAYTTSVGTPSYVDAGYMDNTQQFNGQVKVTDTADVQWTVPIPQSFDDGLDFVSGLNAGNAIMSSSLINRATVQAAAIQAAGDGPNTDQAKISSVLQTIPTQVSIQMKPMEGGPFQQEVVISVSDLIVPKQIDLEAPSNA